MQCHKNFTAKVIQLTPEFSPSVNGHISIDHGVTHTCIVTYYDQGTHENFRKGKSVHSKFTETFQKKYNGPLPKLDDLKNL